jgi:hypothetical protein
MFWDLMARVITNLCIDKIVQSLSSQYAVIFSGLVSVSLLSIKCIIFKNS